MNIKFGMGKFDASLAILILMANLFANYYWITKIPGLPISSPDTESYFNLSVLGSQRSFIVPAIFLLLPNKLFIMNFQVLLNSLSVFYLAIIVLRIANNKHIKILFTFFTVLLVTSTSFFENNFSLMSESISISLSILLFGNLLNHVVSGKPFDWQTLFWLLLWIDVKQGHMLFGIIITLVVIYFITKKKIQISIPRFIAITILFLNTVYCIIFLKSNTQTQAYNLTGIIGSRLCRDANWCEWFYNRGLPKDLIFTLGENQRYLPNINAVLANHELSSWIEVHGTKLLLAFWFSHMFYLFLGPFVINLLSDNFDFADTVFASLGYGSRHLADYVNNLSYSRNFLWWGNEINWGKKFMTVLVVLIIYFFLAYRKKKLKISIVQKYLVGSVAFSVLRLMVDWNLAHGDYSRLFVESSIIIRFSIIIFFVSAYCQLNRQK